MSSRSADIGPNLNPPGWNAAKKTSVGIGAAVAIAILAWTYHKAEIRIFDLLSYSENMIAYLSGFTKPDFMDWPDFANEMLTTVYIALWGTLSSFILAVPFGLLASSNISSNWIRQPVRRVMDTLRAVNELVFAMIFIAAVGMGPFTGVLALFLHNLGVLAKLFSEAVEAIDEGPVEGIRAAGGSRLEEIVYGVIPQALPLWASYTLYRFESNVRSASVLGMIGAGGIGMLLHEAIRSFAYERTAAILIVIILAVVLIDVASSQLRKRII